MGGGKIRKEAARWGSWIKKWLLDYGRFAPADQGVEFLNRRGEEVDWV